MWRKMIRSLESERFGGLDEFLLAQRLTWPRTSGHGQPLHRADGREEPARTFARKTPWRITNT